MIWRHIKFLEIKQSVFENNDGQADFLREELKKGKTFLLDLMSSLGLGKTTTVLKIIDTFKNEIGYSDFDLESVKECVKNLNPNIKIMPIFATRG